jgi:hypothetical protein
MTEESEHVGEIIEASTTEFTAECRELHAPPPFGSFVKASLHLDSAAPTPDFDHEQDPFADTFSSRAGRFNSDFRAVVDGSSEPDSGSLREPTIYAIVHQSATTPVDSSRPVRAYWKDEETLAREQPEVFEWVLVTRFKASVIAHDTGSAIRQFLPPKPPNIHTNVNACTPAEIRILTSRMDFLRTLTSSPNSAADEVVAACIREAYVARNGDFDFLVAAGKELAGLLKDDYDRLQAIMRRVAP